MHSVIITKEKVGNIELCFSILSQLQIQNYKWQNYESLKVQSLIDLIAHTYLMTQKVFMTVSQNYDSVNPDYEILVLRKSFNLTSYMNMR